MNTNLNSASRFRIQTAFACLLLWFAFPPVSCWPLAFVSIALFLPTVLREEKLSAKEYRWLWYCGAVLWLALLQGIRLAYWPLYAGWLALGMYCGAYLPLWIGTCRKLVHGWKIPWQVAAPSTWVAWELFRGYFITGFSACLLGHTVVHEPTLLQIASQLGGYGVSAMIVIGGGLLYQLLGFIPALGFNRRGHRWYELLFPIACISAWILYGIQNVQAPNESDSNAKPLLTAALIQENSPTLFEANPERNARSWQSYLELTTTTRLAHPNLDLVIWPESVFTADNPLLDLEPGFEVPTVWANEGKAQGMDKARVEALSEELLREFNMKAQAAQHNVGRKQFPPNKDSSSVDPTPQKPPHLIVGNDLLRVRGDQMARLNAAVWIDREGKRAGYYAKRHLVMFGEYIPLGDWLPILYSIIGMAPASAGESAQTFDLGNGAQLAPTICFENVLPHLNRRSIVESKAAGHDPSIMINLTNDGWFRGSSILDHHLACATLACVENRRPMLIAANTGLSAWIDGSGRQVAVSKRLAAHAIIANPYRDSRQGLWQQVGDRPWWIVAIVCWTLWVWPRQTRRADKN
jgi:apolipoprotein N-acyltransferase